MNAKNLYELTPEEFEKLIAELLSVSGYSSVSITHGRMDKGIDIIALQNNERVGIQIKHKKNIADNELQEFINRYFSYFDNPRRLIFVTSAEILRGIANQIKHHLPPQLSFDIIDRGDIVKMLNMHREIASRYFKKAKDRIKSQWHSLALGILGAIISMVAWLIPFGFSHRATLDKRIQTVESALSNIRDLETYLVSIKQDMVETEKATQFLKEKYTQAKELEKLTQDQVSALKATLQTENWHRTIFNYAMGFILGIASSLVASVFYSKWHQRKALE